MKKTLCVLACAGLSLVQILHAQLPLNTRPARSFGSARFSAAGVDTTNPNEVDGRELYSPQSVVVDSKSSPTVLYVADTYNNRVLAWFNQTSLNNGAPRADLVIGQRDFYTTFAQGPSGNATFTRGLNQPTGLAVDSHGNLWVVDSGNNRILRFPKDKLTSGDPNQPDIVIGQADFSKSSPNTGGISAQSIYLGPGTASGAATASSIAFDGDGNLWFSDTLNFRVLRYPASSLDPASGPPAADLVLGQAGMASGQQAIAISGAARLGTRNAFYRPTGLAFDPGGRLFVADDLNRVLVFEPPFSTAMSAVRVMGVLVAVAGQPLPPAVNDTTLGAAAVGSVKGVAMIGDRPVVTDASNNRVLIYDPYGAWDAETAAVPSPPARWVIGQDDMNSGRANRGIGEPGPFSLSAPVAVACDGNDLYVADAGNNRVLDFPAGADGTFATAARVWGQFDVWYGGVNLVEGRELNLREIRVSGNTITTDFRGAMALDRNSDPPRLYVADPANNRILGFRDARNVKTDSVADIIIGQPDARRAIVNYPSNDPAARGARGLWGPTGLAVDSNGDLWVADAGNGRVLRFPSPFEQQPDDSGQLPASNLVLGQQDFTSRLTDPTAATMGRPVQVALTTGGDLLVSDAAFNRVLYFRRPPEGDFTSGQQAEKVFGQPDFTTVSPGNEENQLNQPLAIATDTDDYLYVADRGNGRIQIYGRVNGGDPAVPMVMSLTKVGAPYGLFVSRDTGEIWVADFTGRRLLRYPNRNNMILNSDPDFVFQPPLQPLAVTLDTFGNPIVADVGNRLTFYYPTITAVSAASYQTRPLSPGLQVVYGSQAMLSPLNKSFDEEGPADAMPTVLEDVQVLVDGAPSPIRSVSANRISAIVPWKAQTQGVSDVVVMNPSTGRILATGTFATAEATPSLFTVSGDGKGQVVAVNADGTKNDAAHPAKAGDTITLFATGQGPVDGVPEDGTKVGAELPTPEMPLVYFPVSPGGIVTASSSSLVPGEFSLWQIRVAIPNAALGTIQIAVVYKNLASNMDASGNRVVTTITVRQ